MVLTTWLYKGGSTIVQKKKKEKKKSPSVSGFRSPRFQCGPGLVVDLREECRGVSWGGQLISCRTEVGMQRHELGWTAY